MSGTIQISLKVILFIFLFFDLGFSKTKVHIYLIKFDNLDNDQSNDWVRDGFPDVIRDHLITNKDILIKDEKALEEIMNDRSLLHQNYPRSRSVLLLGKFRQVKNDMNIGLQLIDIATWEEVDNRNLYLDRNDIDALSNHLVETVYTMIMPLLPVRNEKPKSELSINPMAKYVQEEMPGRAHELTTSIDRGIDLLEESMDLAIGAKEIPPRIDPDIEGEWVMDLNVDNQEQENPKNEHNTKMLLKVLDNLINSPYSVKLSKPRFEYNAENDDQMNVVLPVTYSLKEAIIKDMLTTLPYSGLRQEGSFTVFLFDKEQFNFPSDLRERLKTGTHRKNPVIRFFNDEGKIAVVIVDTPEAYWHSKTSDEILFVPTHHFSPLIDFTIGGWSLQIAMETVNIQVEYTFTMKLNEIQQLGKVSLKFIPENELDSFLRQFDLGSS